ncbi:hypothetical protein PG990_001166 [Apiospora arundinis]|uniref:Uncharacterized protein n=1 Tax=Apiospora arundinis TaxID=335852 RepID=A0ABR2I1C4_9PEZI
MLFFLDPAAHQLLGLGQPMPVLVALTNGPGQVALETLFNVISELLFIITAVFAGQAILVVIKLILGLVISGENGGITIIIPHDRVTRTAIGELELWVSFRIPWVLKGELHTAIRRLHCTLGRGIPRTTTNLGPVSPLRAFRGFLLLSLTPCFLREHVGAVIKRTRNLFNLRRLMEQITSVDIFALALLGKQRPAGGFLAGCVLIPHRAEVHDDGVVDALYASLPLFLREFLLLLLGGGCRGRRR